MRLPGISAVQQRPCGPSQLHELASGGTDIYIFKSPKGDSNTLSELQNLSWMNEQKEFSWYQARKQIFHTSF